ncbi:MAG: hypothetical protein ACTSUE_13660 [Promethearchaeota archaeon]
MTEQDINREDDDEFNKVRKQGLSRGLYGNALMYAMMGLFAIMVSRLLATMPLNTPGVYDTIGNVDHIYGVRYISSSVLFAFGGFFALVAYLYINKPEIRGTTFLAKLAAFLKQPYVPIVFIFLGILWGIQVFDPSGDVSAFFAKMMGLDMSINEDVLHYKFILSGYPILEFLIIGSFMLVVSPFSMYSSAILFQDTGMVLNKRRSKKKPKSFETRERLYATKGLFAVSLISLMVAGVLYVIGFAMGVGFDIGFGLFNMANYKVIMTVYPIFPIAFTIFCWVTCIMYFHRPHEPASRIMAWTAFFIQLVIPLFGWFYGALLYQNLRLTGKQGRDEKGNKREKIRIITSAVIALVVVGIPLITIWLRGMI